MSLMYKLIEEGRNQERKKVAQDLINSGVERQRIKKITGLSEKKLKEIEKNLFN